MSSPHHTPTYPNTHPPNRYCAQCPANTIVSQQKSKWPPPPLHFDKEQGNWTLRGCLDQGKATRAGSAGGGGGAAGGPGVAYVEEAERAGTVARMAQCCDENGTSYCFWLAIRGA